MWNILFSTFYLPNVGVADELDLTIVDEKPGVVPEMITTNLNIHYSLSS